MPSILVNRGARSSDRLKERFTLISYGIIFTVLLRKVGAISRIHLPQMNHGIFMVAHADTAAAHKLLLLLAGTHRPQQQDCYPLNRRKCSYFAQYLIHNMQTASIALNGS